MPQRRATAEQDQQIAAAATRESWPYTDVRANYEIAERARNAQFEGRERAHA